MRFGSRPDPHPPHFGELWNAIGHATNDALAVHESPRTSPEVANALGVLWPGSQGVSAAAPVQGHTGAPDEAVAHEFSETLLQVSPTLPADSAARYDAAAEALRRMIQTSAAELATRQEAFLLVCLAFAVRAASQLYAACLHDTLCDLTLELDRILIQARYTDAGDEIEGLCLAIYSCLAGMPPGETPRLWELLADRAASESLWPVLKHMRNRDSLPYILKILPSLEPDGQVAAIAGIRGIGDARAVPTLQALLENGARDLSPVIVTDAITYLMRHGTSDAAQLLRPSDVTQQSDRGATLLRPAQETPDARPAQELLRPDEDEKPDAKTK